MVKINDRAIWLFLAILVVLVFGLFSDLGLFKNKDLERITGGATTADATTSAFIDNYFAINMSANMSADGIKFDIQELPVYDANTTANYDNSSGGLNQTKLFLTVEMDSNVNVRFCIKSNDTYLRAGSNVIGIGNYTWSNSSVNNLTWPAFSLARALTNETYDNSSINIGKGNSSYYRFWLDVPGEQAPGTYKNQVNFKGVQQGTDC